MCTETPEVRFEDVITLDLSKHEPTAHVEGFRRILTYTVKIDEEFIAVCEPGSITAVGGVCEEPLVFGSRVEGTEIQILVHDFTGRASQTGPIISVQLSGIRRGRAGVRFPEFTHEDMIRNDKFWSTPLRDPDAE